MRRVLAALVVTHAAAAFAQNVPPGQPAADAGFSSIAAPASQAASPAPAWGLGDLGSTGMTGGADAGVDEDTQASRSTDAGAEPNRASANRMAVGPGLLVGDGADAGTEQTDRFGNDPPPPPKTTAPEGETVVYASSRRAVPSRRLSGEELARRGAETLADALDLLPHSRVRQGGRGDFRIDIRGARQGAIRVFVDGVPMEDPYLGRFDVGSVPISDVVEIRVYPTPLSPIDGAGGAAGWVEVETLSASGPARIEGRARVGYPLDLRLAATARHPLAGGVGARISASVNQRQQPLALNQADGTQRDYDARSQLAHAALRLEGKWDRLRVWLDAAAYHTCSDVPPGEDLNPRIQRTCPQNALRSVLGARWTDDVWAVSSEAYGLLLGRTSLSFDTLDDVDPRLTENVWANRGGGSVRITRLLGKGWRAGARFGVDSEWAKIAVNNLAPVMGSGVTAIPALQLGYDSTLLRAELAAGLSVPFTPAAPVWPEAKLNVEVRPFERFVGSITAATKGRLPTLRERYDPSFGDPSLRPEVQYYVDAEIRRPDPLVSPRVTGYHRWTNGLIQLDPSRLRLNNLAKTRSAGLEVAVDLNRNGIVGGGLAYSLLWVKDPLENQPGHQAEAYFSLTWKRFGGMARFQWVGTRPESGVMLRPYGVLDLSAWYRVNEALRITARADNLLHAHYQQRANLLSIGRVVTLGLQLSLD